MQCIKTGCEIFLMTHGVFLHGDAFEINETLIVRVCGISTEPFGSRRHFTVMHEAKWFDRDKTSMSHNSTLVVERGFWNNHGYHGIPEPTLDAPVSPLDETIDEA